MTKQSLFAIFITLLLTSLQTFSAEESKYLALQAILARNYDCAISICLEQLEIYPDDSDYQFLLAQAYAYSQKWPEALEVLDRLMAAHPDNMDALLLWSRVRAWNKVYDAAQQGYKKVLQTDPNNAEAKMGLAETASWQGDYANAIDIYQIILEHDPSNPDLYYRLGLLYGRGGYYAKAQENLRTAIKLAPDNQEYKNALISFHPQFRNRFEIRYDQRVESFSDHKDHFRNQSLVLLSPSPGNRGPFLFRASQIRRTDQSDSQFGFDFYPRLWKGAYGYFNLSYSPKAYWYPRSSYAAEVYQSLLSSAELSLGFRHMSFAENPVSIYLGSLGYYFSSYYSSFRWYYSLQKKDHSFSWTIQVRRYFSGENFVFLSYGQGSRPFDVDTIDDFLIIRSRIFQAGITFYMMQHIRLECHMLFTNEKNGLNRAAFYLSSGYRW